MTKLYDQTGNFVNRMRWKAIFFEKKNSSKNAKPSNKSKYNIFPSTRSAPVVDKLIPFEYDLYKLIRSIKFRKVRSTFQNKLTTDLNKIKASDKIIGFADKTANLYHLEPEAYMKLVKDNITKDYQITENDTINIINDEAKEIIETNGISGRIPKYEISDAFVTLKDHKDDFPRVQKCRLINPIKPTSQKSARRYYKVR